MQFSEERINRLLNELKNHLYTQEMEISQFQMLQNKARQYKPDVLDFSQSVVYNSGEPWVPGSRFTWFDAQITLPAAFEGAYVVFEAFTDTDDGWAACNPQFMLYVDGKIRQGLDINHQQACLTPCAAGGHTFRLTLSGFADCRDQALFLKTRLKCLNREIEQYYYDLLIPYQIARLQDRDSEIWHDLTTHLNASLNLLDLRRNSPRFIESLRSAHAYLKTHIYQQLADGLSADQPRPDDSAKANRPAVFCVGHTHIDVAWLWPLGITKDKTVRSFATVLALMEEYPEYQFMSSQPQLYQFIEQNAPELMTVIQKRVEEGRWETEGAMFVEADCNLASGESLVRQILHGKNYFAEKFGQENRILWLPDVFGYSAALPQIMKKSGIDYFMTTKISWNEVNKMPYDTFEWSGLDGTKVLTHFMPTRDYEKGQPETGRHSAHFTTYNGILNPSQVKGSWQRYQQKDLNRSVLMAYGFGDGGGGPTREMLETQKRLMQGLPGLPTVRPSSALSFFRQLEKEVSDKANLPVWHGELYLEYHRGTYTSMARNKKYNRRAEFAWLNAEWLGVLAHLLLDQPYPKKIITQNGQTILRNQFHDILPGSSIKQVYDESKIEYQKVFADLDQLMENLLSQFADALQSTNTVDSHKAQPQPAQPAQLAQLAQQPQEPQEPQQPQELKPAQSETANHQAKPATAKHQASLAVFNPSGLTVGSPILINLPSSWQNPVITGADGKFTCQRMTIATELKPGLTAWYPASLLASQTTAGHIQSTTHVQLSSSDSHRPAAFADASSLLSKNSVEDSNVTSWLAYLPQVKAKGYQLYQISDCDTDSSSSSSFDSDSDSDSDYPNFDTSHNGSDFYPNEFLEPSVSSTSLENQFFLIKLDDAGQIISCFDRQAERELIPHGKIANQLISYEDKPLKYDAWDINAYYTEKSWPINHVEAIDLTESGPLRWTLTITRRYLSSTIKQTISIWRNLPQIDLGFDIDWKEEQILLKALFPIDIQSDKATFDIQYGNVERPTHTNTSWDAARFEVCVHKWLDVSEDNYGLSLLNDCKYGCHVNEGVIGMTLLKSALHPNPAADKERHRFMLVLRPHQGGWRQARTVNAAYALNNPFIARLLAPLGMKRKNDGPNTFDHRRGKASSVSNLLPLSFSLISCNQENVIIESVKQAEKSDAVIIRLYECYHRRTNCCLTFGLPLKALSLCSLMEETTDNLTYETNAENQSIARLTIKPYEIITLKASF